jgi:hypothetical protein
VLAVLPIQLILLLVVAEKILRLLLLWLLAVALGVVMETALKLIVLVLGLQVAVEVELAKGFITVTVFKDSQAVFLLFHLIMALVAVVVLQHKVVMGQLLLVGLGAQEH